MAASETSIANGALILLGERRINSIDDTTKTAKLMKDRFDEIRDDLLRSHPWNFATKRASLDADSGAPAWGFDYQYTLPSDSLRLIEVDNPNRYDYRVEERKILTNIGTPLLVAYTSQITDPTSMDVMFRQALSASLAADLCEAITGTTSKVESMLGIRELKIRKSRVPDGQEPAPKTAYASEWEDSRETSGAWRRASDEEGTPL